MCLEDVDEPPSESLLLLVGYYESFLSFLTPPRLIPLWDIIDSTNTIIIKYLIYNHLWIKTYIFDQIHWNRGSICNQYLKHIYDGIYVHIWKCTLLKYPTCTLNHAYSNRTWFSSYVIPWTIKKFMTQKIYHTHRFLRSIVSESKSLISNLLALVRIFSWCSSVITLSSNVYLNS